MPRNGSGVYSLPTGNPVVAGTTITSAWANTTMSDVATELTNSLDRFGRGGMLAAFTFADGTTAAPGMAWVNETSTGFFRKSSGDMRLSLLNQDILRWTKAAAQPVMELWHQTNLDWAPVLYADGPNVPITGVDEGSYLRFDATTDNEWKVSPHIKEKSAAVPWLGNGTADEGLTILSLGAGAVAINAGAVGDAPLTSSVAVTLAGTSATVKADSGNLALRANAGALPGIITLGVDGGEDVVISNEGSVNVGGAGTNSRFRVKNVGTGPIFALEDSAGDQVWVTDQNGDVRTDGNIAINFGTADANVAFKTKGTGSGNVAEFETSGGTVALLMQETGYVSMPATYGRTSAQPANVHIDSQGRLYRSTA